jgi:hypothetical protein
MLAMRFQSDLMCVLLIGIVAASLMHLGYSKPDAPWHLVRAANRAATAPDPVPLPDLEPGRDDAHLPVPTFVRYVSVERPAFQESQCCPNNFRILLCEKNGSPYGMQFVSLPKRCFIKDLGLRESDILLAVNRTPVFQPEQAIDAFFQLVKNDIVVLLFERNGRVGALVVQYKKPLLPLAGSVRKHKPG